MSTVAWGHWPLSKGTSPKIRVGAAGRLFVRLKEMNHMHGFCPSDKSVSEVLLGWNREALHVESTVRA